MRRFAGEFKKKFMTRTRLDSFDPIESSESLNSSNATHQARSTSASFSDLKSDVDSIERLCEHLFVAFEHAPLHVLIFNLAILPTSSLSNNILGCQ